MKKIIYSLMGITALAFALSCEKEQELPKEEAKTVAGNENPEVLPANIPAAITASLVDTKTSYDETGAFSWTIGENGDHIYLMFYKEDTHYQGWVEYKATSADANGKAVFTIVSNQGERISELADYTNSGVAVYGAGSDNHVARPYTDNNEACTLYKPDGEHTVSYDPFLTLRQSLAGASSEVVLLGTGVGDTDSNTGVFTDYHFYTACAVLRVTISGIPANAKELRLCTADKVNYPLNGDFAIRYIKANSDVPELTVNDYRQRLDGSTYTDSCDDYIAAAWDGTSETQTFYFNVPTGEYPANTLSVQLVNTNDGEILKKTITADYTFHRNDLVPASFANEWTTLGTGKFIDNFLWAKIVAKGAVDKDLLDYADVTIQQSNVDNKSFRLVDPYGAAATAFGYTSVNASARDEFLMFTVDDFSQGSAVSNYSTHKTGFAIDDGNKNPELIYPTTYNNSLSTSQNVVVAAGESYPIIVQLAPVYHYSGSALTDSYTYKKAPNLKGVFRIIFPGVTDFNSSLVLGSSCKSDLTALDYTRATNAGRVQLVVSEYTDYQIAAPDENGLNSYKIGSYPGASSGANNSGSGWNPGIISNVPSGPVYLTWYSLDSSSANYIYDQGRTKVYLINSADKGILIKQHSVFSSDSNLTSGTLTFELSDDPANSNIKMVEFDGLEPNPNSEVITSSHRLFAATGNYLVNGDYPYSASNLLEGEPMYGICSSGSIILDATHPFLKYGTNEQNASIYLFNQGTASSYNIPSSLEFNYNPYLTSAKNPIKVRVEGYTQPWGKSDGGSNTYVADISSIPSGMTAVNMSNCTITSNSSVDSNQIPSKLVDEDLTTIWHSVYNNPRPYDETYGVYLTVQLPSDLKTFQVLFCTRHNNSEGNPRELVYWTSNDGTNWEQLMQGESPLVQTSDVKTKGTWVTLPAITAPSAFRYLRIGITKSGNGNTPTTLSSNAGFTYMAELRIYGKNS